MKTSTLAFFVLMISVLNFFGQVSSEKTRELSRQFQERNKKGQDKQAMPCNKDSMIYEMWDTLQGYQNMNLVVYSYDNNFNVTKTVAYNWNNGIKVPYFQHVFVYDNQSNLLSELNQNWNVLGSWENTTMTEYTYDNQHNLLTVTTKYWYVSTSSWKNDLRFTYVYGSGNQMLNMTSEVWDVPLNSFQNFDKCFYTFSGNNLTSELYHHWNSTTSAWENSYTINKTFSSSGYLTSSLNQIWDPLLSAWKNSYSLTATYSGNAKMMHSEYAWDALTNSWEHAVKITYTNDINANPLRQLYQIWDNATNTWVFNHQFFCTFDANNNVTSELIQTWNILANTWINASHATWSFDSNNNVFVEERGVWTANVWEHLARWTNYYDCTTVGIPENQSDTKGIRLYPNPANDELHIKTDLAFTQMNVISLNGQKVYTREKSEILSTSQLEPGIYLLQLNDKNGSVLRTEKFIKE